MISSDDIQREAKELAPAEPKKRGSAHILSVLLKNVEQVDFKAEVYPKPLAILIKRKEEAQKAGNEDELQFIQAEIDKLKLFHKHYLIVTVEKLLKIARENSWDLCKRYGYYYVYDGTHWKVIDKAELSTFLGKVAEKMSVPKFDSRHYEFKDKLFKQFEASAHLPAPQIPDGTILINLLNGTLEITPESQKPRDFNADDFLTYQMAFKYDRKATAPNFKRYINRVLPDPESQRVLAEFMGYIFMRDLKLEKVLFLYGSGSNGKSVMFDIIGAMLGEDNISSYSLVSLTDEKGYNRAKLVNKVLNYASDVGDKLNSAKFKQLGSGEPIEARLPYKEPFMLRNVCKFAFNTNTLPVDVEHTTAFFRRFLIIPFNVCITDEEKDPELSKKIITNELPGVLNWVLDGLNRLVEQRKFSHCQASDDTLNQFRKESDSVALFVDDMGYQPDLEMWVQEKPIYTKYRAWAYDEGLKPLARKNFQKRLEALGFFLATKNVGKVIHMEKYTNGTI